MSSSADISAVKRRQDAGQGNPIRLILAQIDTQTALKLRDDQEVYSTLRICRRCILLCSVVRFNPSCSAAPPAPAIFP